MDRAAEGGKVTHPLTVSMTPAYWFPGDALLRAQLRCLSVQTVKDFDVLLVDAHYSKRKDYIPELAERYKLVITHVPYVANTRVAKKLDCSIFNAGYVYSQAERNVRYSCWRFVRPTFVESLLSVPKHINTDLDFMNVGPCADADRHPQTGHSLCVWDGASDEVRWDNIPKCAGTPGAKWSNYSDRDKSPIGPVPINCYGNICWTRKNWLDVNGTDEAFTNLEHYEDMHFCLRVRNAKQKAIRIPHLMYRLEHHHGTHGGYANAPMDVPYTKPCIECEYANAHAHAPKRYDIAARLERGSIEVFPDEGVWVCKLCLLCGGMWNSGCGEFLEHIRASGRTQATVLPKYMIGRNLRTLAADMDKQTTLAGKVELYNVHSHYDPRYYTVG